MCLMDRILVSELEASGLPRHVALKAAIAAAGVRQFAIAQKLGIPEARLSLMLTGRRPISDDDASRISAAIDALAAT